MLIFTYEQEIMPEEFRARLEKTLEQRTGQTCLVLPGCTGVHEVLSEKE